MSSTVATKAIEALWEEDRWGKRAERPPRARSGFVQVPSTAMCNP